MICSNTQEAIFLHCHNEQDTRDKQHIIILCVFLCVHANPFLPSLTFRQGLKTQQILVPEGSHPSTFNIEMPSGGHDEAPCHHPSSPLPALLQAQGTFFKPEHDWNSECLSAHVRHCSSCSMHVVPFTRTPWLHLTHLESVEVMFGAIP